jgi:hypothetical protein
MLKVTQIRILEAYKLLCFFNTNEQKVLDLRQALDSDNEMVQTILQPHIFKTAKVGELGEILWENTGKIRELDGSVTLCAYDISPEFAYHYSVNKEA